MLVLAVIVGAPAVSLMLSGEPLEDQFGAITFVAGVVGIGVLITIAALVAYHRGWSRFERRVSVQRNEVTTLAWNARHAREEGARLESLHRQTVDWLVLLSTAIHQPWHVPAEWKRRDQHAIVNNTMPFALRVATAREDDELANAYLESVVAEHLFVKGWRYQAFESLVRNVAAERGRFRRRSDYKRWMRTCHTPRTTLEICSSRR